MNREKMIEKLEGIIEKYSEYSTCPRCGGGGNERYFEKDALPCHVCKGSGRIKQPIKNKIAVGIIDAGFVDRGGEEI